MAPLKRTKVVVSHELRNKSQLEYFLSMKGLQTLLGNDCYLHDKASVPVTSTVICMSISYSY